MNSKDINPRGPAQRYPDSASPITRDPKSVDQGHQSSDLNSSIFAQHHNLGSSPNQSSPGDHIHDGSNSKQLDLSVIDDLNWIQWTPVVTNGGSAVFTTTDGWWQKVGNLAFFNLYLVCGTAGSGTGKLLITLPFTPYRGSANRRQVYTAAISDAIGTGGQVGPLAAWTFAGSATGVDRLVMSNGVDLAGSHIAVGSILTVEGIARIA